MTALYDVSPPALQNYATGNPHYDCRKFGPEDTLFLCYLASDRDCDSAEAALDRLRALLPTAQIEPYLNVVYQTARLIQLGNENVTVVDAARDLLEKMERFNIAPTPHKRLELTQSTGWPELDVLLCEVITDLVGVFGDRILSCFAVGSAFDGSGVPSSDVDLHLLFKGAHSAYLKRAVQEFSRELSKMHDRDLDLIPFFESDIKPWADVRTKLGGIQIFGTASSDMLVLPEMSDYVRENMHRAYYYMARVRGFPDSLCYPVAAPMVNDTYYGYNTRRHDDGSTSTKELVVVAGWLSTALVTRSAQIYVASKSASYAGYRQHVNDEWADHLKDVFELVREKWNYRIPSEDGEKAKLAEICRRQVAFENHFLAQYQSFLQAECLSCDPIHAERARKLLQEVFPTAEGPKERPRLLVPAWQINTKRVLDSHLTSVDHFLVKVDSLRSLGDKALRETYQRFEEFGVVVFACKNTLDLKYDLLGLQNYFGQVVFHPRSDATGITSVRNLFQPKQGFAGTTNAMQTAHTDGSFLPRPPGIVALQTEICGLCGGESMLVFGDALYRYLEEHHPSDIEKLYREDTYTIGRGEDSCTRPVFWKEENRVRMAFRCGNGESLEVAMWARLPFNHIYHFVNAPKNQIRFRLPANHVLVVDNHRNLHGRLSWPPDTVRCLNRLWLDGKGTNPCYPGLGMRL